MWEFKSKRRTNEIKAKFRKNPGRKIRGSLDIFTINFCADVRLGLFLWRWKQDSKTYNFVVHDKFRIKNIFEVKSDMEVGSGKKTPKITGLASQI